MNGGDIYFTVCDMADAMCRRGRAPHVVEVGRMQDRALQEYGASGDTLTVYVSAGESPAFVGPGEPLPANYSHPMVLRIDRVDQDDWLQVTAGRADR